MAKRRNYIPNDGYTLVGYLDSRDGMNESIRFTYRPISSEQQSVFQATLSQLSDSVTNPAAFRKRAEIIRDRLLSWDVVDDKGKCLPITSVEIRKLSPDIFWRLYGVIYGTLPTDIDPNWADEDQQAEVALASQAEALNAAVGVVREANDEKNLG